MLKSKKIISLFAILSMVVMSSGLTSSAQASSITNASDTLSASGLSQVATHTIAFTIHSSLAQNDYIQVVLPGGGGANFGNITAVGNIICATGSATWTSITEARCTIGAGGLAAGASSTMTLTGVTNPNAIGSKTIAVKTYTAANALIERADVMIAIVDRVVVTASVASTLNFVISPVAGATVINGATTTAGSATATIAFGNLTANAEHIIGQQLNVTTNATYGFKVTVEQNQDLTSAGNAIIDAFDDGTPSTTAAGWSVPATSLGQFNTYGHMGLTSDDNSLSVNQFATSTYKGFNGTTPMEVMYHTGASNGSAQSIGLAKVAYRIEVSSLQEAGDYTNTLTYIATPIY